MRDGAGKMKKYRVVHYINQFFAGIGGEEKAGIEPWFEDKPVGFGRQIEEASGGRLEVVRTVICGDNYAAENLEEFEKTTLPWIKEVDADLLFAGPAFGAGRYGTACGTLCDRVSSLLGLIAISGMHETNPGVDVAKRTTYILKTGDSARKIGMVVSEMIHFGLRLLDGDEIGSPEEEGYHPRGVRINFRRKERGSKRAVSMLLKKVHGEPFETELPMPVYDLVPPAPPVVNLEEALIAIGTEGGIVPRGNPDRIEAHNASKWCAYSLEGLDNLLKGDFEVAHGGYDLVHANEDPDRVLPLDGMRRLEKAGRFRKLLDKYFVTVGNVTAVKSAERYGREIAAMLHDEGVDGVVMTST